MNIKDLMTKDPLKESFKKYSTITTERSDDKVRIKMSIDVEGIFNDVLPGYRKP